MAILDGLTRSANVTAMEDSEIFIIQRSDFLELLHTHPEVASCAAARTNPKTARG